MATSKESNTGAEIKVYLPGIFGEYDHDHAKKLAEMFAQLAGGVASLPPGVSCVFLHALDRALGTFVRDQAILLIKEVASAEDPQKKAAEILQGWGLADVHVNPRADEANFDLERWNRLFFKKDSGPS